MAILEQNECGIIVCHEKTLNYGVRNVISLKNEISENSLIEYRALEDQFSIHRPFQMDTCFNAALQTISRDGTTSQSDEIGTKDSSSPQNSRKRKRKRKVALKYL